MKRSPLKRTRGWPQGLSARQLVRKESLDSITDALILRARHRCEICKVGRIEHRHHRLRRSQGGGEDLNNLMALCHLCHEFVHHNPRLSYERGWLIRSGKSVDVAVEEA